MSQREILDGNPDAIAEEEGRYLLFQLGSELYGTPLLGVREVVEPQKWKLVPNTVSYFKGVINIRGQIVGLVDLRLRFGYESLPNAHQALLVFETEAGPIAAIVDSVESVVQIAGAAIERHPNVASHLPVEYLIGIANHQNRLITIIDLNRALAGEDYVAIRKGKMVA